MGVTLVTGGTGFLGVHVARSLAERGEDVLVSYRRGFRVPRLLADFMGSRVKAVRCDVLDFPEIVRTIQNNGVRGIVHAANISPYEGSLYQMAKTNIEGTINLLEAASIGHVQKVTYVSSGSVSRTEEESVPIHSDMPISAHKKIGEILSLFYGREFAFPVSIVRPHFIYGPYCMAELTSPLAIINMVEGAATGKPVDLPHINPAAKLDLIHAQDCGNAISLIHLAAKPQHQVYLLSGEKTMTFRDLAKTIKDIVPGSAINLGVEHDGGKGESVPFRYETTRLHTEFGYKHIYPLREGLAQYIKWYQDGQQ